MPARAPKNGPRKGRIYGGQSDDERRAARRERLMQAGLALFGRLGYAQVAIERLCGEAELISRYFYESFASREELLVAIYDRIVDDTLQRVIAALAAAPVDPLQRIRHGIAAFTASYLDDPCRGRIVCIEVVGVSPRLERHRRDGLWRFADIVLGEIRALMRAGLVPRRNARYTAMALAGATNELIIESLMTRAPLSRRRLEREIAIVYLATLFGSSAADAAVASMDPLPGGVKGRRATTAGVP